MLVGWWWLLAPQLNDALEEAGAGGDHGGHGAGGCVPLVGWGGGEQQATPLVLAQVKEALVTVHFDQGLRGEYNHQKFEKMKYK